MGDIYTIAFYFFSFLSIYVQVFFLITFLEKKRYIKYCPEKLDLKYYPTVTVAIPCFNEENAIGKTINSLLALDYPKDKFSIFIIDDGSTDNTWQEIKEFEKYQNVKIFQQKNGGKHTALNLALKNTKSTYFGCLDSDSFVHPQALKRIMKHFENDPTNMAVIPTITVYNPKNIIQKAQRVEYIMTVYTKKMLGLIDGIHVTPGPLSIFNKKVFEDLGLYRKAHNTEDQEIALRMHEHGYKIDHCADAFVYTIVPDTISKLYRQRLRWIYGFFKNMIDYRRLIFRKKYGTISLLTIPSGLISIIGVLFLFFIFIINFSEFIYNKIIQLNLIGFSPSLHFKFDWFFIPTQVTFFIIIFLYVMVIVSVILGKKISKEKNNFSVTILYFIIMYSTLAPFWFLKAVYNTIRSRESNWKFERQVKI